MGGFLLTMAALSLSQYKLPHYIFIVCPLAAIICSGYWMDRWKAVKIKTWFLIQGIFLFVLLSFSVVLIYYFNRSYPLYFFIAFLTVLFLSWIFWKHFDMRESMIMISVLVFAFINLELNTLFYPHLLKYQSSSEAAFYIRENHLNSNHIAGYNAYGHALSYYLDTIVPYYWDLEDIKRLDPGTLVYTNTDGLADLERNKLSFQLIHAFDEYKVTRLSLEFLNPETREAAISKRYLIRLKPAQEPM
jgi:hypothetical protein